MTRAAKDYLPIPCALHDHLELACIRATPLMIELRDGSVIHGVASDTLCGHESAEWLLLRQDDGDDCGIRLDWILAITPCEPQACERIVFLPKKPDGLSATYKPLSTAALKTKQTSGQK